MPKSLDPKLVLEVHRDLLRKEASVSLQKAVDGEDAEASAGLIDRAAAALRYRDTLGKAEPLG